MCMYVCVCAFWRCFSVGESFNALRSLPVFRDALRDTQWRCDDVASSLDTLLLAVAGCKRVQQLFDDSLVRLSELQQQCVVVHFFYISKM